MRNNAKAPEFSVSLGVGIDPYSQPSQDFSQIWHDLVNKVPFDKAIAAYRSRVHVYRSANTSFQRVNLDQKVKEPDRKEVDH